MTHAVGVVPSADPRSRNPAGMTAQPWRAECACGWKGDARTKKREAVEDAAAHVRAAVASPAK